jgi:hypothetical protein
MLSGGDKLAFSIFVFFLFVNKLCKKQEQTNYVKPSRRTHYKPGYIYPRPEMAE